MSIDLEALKKLEQAATPGPWFHEHEKHENCRVVAQEHRDDKAKDAENNYYVVISYGDCGEDCHNTHFIAAARNTIRPIIDELEAARKEITKLEIYADLMRAGEKDSNARIAELERENERLKEANLKLRLDHARLAESIAKLWDSVARGVHDARSLVGDETLHMKEIIFGDKWPSAESIREIQHELALEAKK
jgi:hypothetical protein